VRIHSIYIYIVYIYNMGIYNCMCVYSVLCHI
jgi:hypothetical protein